MIAALLPSVALANEMPLTFKDACHTFAMTGGDEDHPVWAFLEERP